MIELTGDEVLQPMPTDVRPLNKFKSGDIKYLSGFGKLVSTGEKVVFCGLCWVSLVDGWNIVIHTGEKLVEANIANVTEHAYFTVVYSGDKTSDKR